MTRQVVFARHRVDEKKTLVSFMRGQKVAKCGTLTAKNISTCSVAMDPTSLVTGTRWGTLRSRILGEVGGRTQHERQVEHEEEHVQAVERAVAEQMELRDTATGPGTVMVEVLRPPGLEKR